MVIRTLHSSEIRTLHLWPFHTCKLVFIFILNDEVHRPDNPLNFRLLKSIFINNDN